MSESLGLDGVADARTTCAAFLLVGAFQIPLVPWVDFKAARKRAAQGLVGGDERAHRS